MQQPDRSQLGDILVVDDDPMIVEMLMELLAFEGYAARGAHDGQEALEAIFARPPALVLLDLQMPRMRGAELIDALARTSFADLPIIIITASPAEAKRITLASNVAYMAKPLDLDALLAGITGVMCRQREPSTPDTSYTRLQPPPSFRCRISNTTDERPPAPRTGPAAG